MSDPDRESVVDAELQALFALDAPAARDADFVLAVVRRAHRQRLAFEIVWLGLVASLSALVLWAVGPVLAPVARPLAGLAALFAPLVLSVGAVLVLVHPRTSPF